MHIGIERGVGGRGMVQDLSRAIRLAKIDGKTGQDDAGWGEEDQA